ncbi:MAG: glycogen/starch synthase [Gemmatimonadales bacterium]
MTTLPLLELPPIEGTPPMLVHLSAEYYPYARTGGLAEAARGLHRYQARRGLETAAILPLYRAAHAHLNAMEQVGDPYTLDFGGREEHFRLWRDHDPASETPTYFIQHDGFFDRAGIYGEGGRDYPDNHLRFAAFAAAAVAALPRLTDGPVVLHAHDWHASLAAVYLRHWFGGDPWYDRIPVVLSVHNGGYQGHFPAGGDARDRPAVAALHARRARVVRQGQLPEGRPDARRHGDDGLARPLRSSCAPPRVASACRASIRRWVIASPACSTGSTSTPGIRAPIGTSPPATARTTWPASAPARPTCSAASGSPRIRSSR